MRAYQNHRPNLSEGVYIDPDATVIGQVHLGEDVSIWPRAVLRGDVNTIHVGARSNIQDGCICHVTHDGPYTPGGYPLVIGEDVTVGHGAILHGATIEARTLIGMGAIVLDGAVVQSEVMVGAGALVSPGKKLESGYLYVGKPAVKARRLTDREIESLSYSAAHYVKVKNHFMT